VIGTIAKGIAGREVRKLGDGQGGTGVIPPMLSDDGLGTVVLSLSGVDPRDRNDREGIAGL
jgi:hypothetical protein